MTVYIVYEFRPYEGENFIGVSLTMRGAKGIARKYLRDNKDLPRKIVWNHASYIEAIYTSTEYYSVYIRSVNVSK